MNPELEKLYAEQEKTQKELASVPLPKRAFLRFRRRCHATVFAR